MFHSTAADVSSNLLPYLKDLLRFGTNDVVYMLSVMVVKGYISLITHILSIGIQPCIKSGFWIDSAAANSSQKIAQCMKCNVDLRNIEEATRHSCVTQNFKMEWPIINKV